MRDEHACTSRAAPAGLSRRASSSPACPPPAAWRSASACPTAAEAMAGGAGALGQAGPGRRPEVNAWIVDRARRERCSSASPSRRWAQGILTVAADARRRGTGLRLGQGHGRICLRQPQPPRATGSMAAWAPAAAASVRRSREMLQQAGASAPRPADRGGGAALGRAGRPNATRGGRVRACTPPAAAA